MFMFPQYKDLKTQWGWGIYSLEDMQWYVDMGVIDKEEYALITGEKYPDEETRTDDGISEGHY